MFRQAMKAVAGLLTHPLFLLFMSPFVPLILGLSGRLNSTWSAPIWAALGLPIGVLLLGLFLGRWIAERKTKADQPPPGYGLKWTEAGGVQWRFSREWIDGRDGGFRREDGPLCPLCKRTIRFVCGEFPEGIAFAITGPDPSRLWPLSAKWTCYECGEIDGEVTIYEPDINKLTDFGGQYWDIFGYIMTRAGDEARAEFRREEYR